MKRIRNFIWDFDGTLFDTYPLIIENLRKALQEYDCDCDPTEAMRLMLDNIAAARNYYASKYGLDPEQLLEAYNRHHQKVIAALQAKPIAGVQAVLEHIRATGRRSYIFTHRKYDETVAFLKKYGLEGYFQEIVGQDTAHFAWKPAPDALLYLMEKYKMKPEETVMVGDRDCDLGSARNAGILTAHLVCAVAPETLDCNWRLKDFDQMLSIL
ncbi:MAG: HAD-IA family hydrolase [Oscillospiraceae bacterium]|nr:HAD-IA family hydrolase [Oscillospiraceae bacterium]